jgi:aspartate--ammonia ligase
METKPIDLKKKDLAGPGIGNYDELKNVLPNNYNSLLTPRETQLAITELKRFIEDGLSKELNLMKVEVPLIVDDESGFNDNLDRDGSRTPIEFHINNDYNKNPVNAQVVQAATKWKRYSLKEFDMQPGEGIITDMRAVRKDYFLDHDHSAYVDQWDWEKTIRPEDRTLDYLTDTVKKIWRVIKVAEMYIQEKFPQLKTDRVSESS